MNPKNSNTIDLSQIVIKQFFPKEASRDTWDKLHIFNEKNFKELHPNDSIPNREVVEKNTIAGVYGYEIYHYIIYKDETEEEVIANMDYDHLRKDNPGYEKNKDNSYFYIIVASENRKQGLGTKLFEMVLKKIDDIGCKYTETDSAFDSGKGFCEKFNGKQINFWVENRLQIEDIDWDLVNSWLVEGPQKAPRVTLGNYHITPEEDIVEIAKLETELEGDMPSLEDDEEKWKEVFTPETIRKYEQKHTDNGTTIYVVFTREPDGTISGLSGTRHNPNDRPERVEQGLTGVKKEYRGKGLGKWLKAAMLTYVKEKYHEVKYITTGNADHNAPMNSINNRLGFKPVLRANSYKFNIKETLEKFQKK